MHLVPEDAKEEVLQRMSPRYVNVYKKNLEPLFVPDHEALNGLAVLSEMKGDPEEIKDPREYYTSYADLVRDVEMDRKLPLDKPIRFTGKVGGVEYKDKITTYGRLKLSKIIEADIDFVPIWKDMEKFPQDRINSGSGAKLYQFLYPQPDGVEKIKKLQEAALKAVTKAGVVTFDFSTLYADTDTKTYKKMREIADSNELTDKQKLLMLTEMYKKYSKEVEDSYSDDLKNELSRAARVKIHSIMDTTMPQFIVSGVDEKPIINQGSLLNGLTETEYHYHAIENRSLQSIKQMGVPSGGLFCQIVRYKLHKMLES